MRLVVDALGAPARSGGMRLYATELLHAWTQVAPDDELHVVGYPWLEGEFAAAGQVRVHMVRESTSARLLGQWTYTPRVARRVRASALLSLSHVVSPLSGLPRGCVVHDWRHFKRPEEFSPLQRAYRRTWRWSVEHADVAIQISAKTDRETASIAPSAQRSIVSNGADHARRWPVLERPDESIRRIVTFGHQTNKRPELLIRAMPELDPDDRLVVLGAQGEYAEQLGALAQAVGVEDRVDFPGFVDEPTYQRLIQFADLVALVSTDEGYGLPVVEAAYFGIPVVAADDSGLSEIHPNVVLDSRPEPSALAAAIRLGLGSAKSHSDPPTNSWLDTAVGVRDVLARVVEGSLEH